MHKHNTTKPVPGPRPTMSIQAFEALLKEKDGKVRVRR